MVEFDIDELLRENPRAARHADSVREVLGVIRKLREAGFAGEHHSVEVPYTGRASIKDAPRPASRQSIKAHSKVTFLLGR